MGMAMDMVMDIMVTCMESKIYVCIKHCIISLPNTNIKLRYCKIQREGEREREREREREPM